jgi:hypothetical protein
MDHILQGIEFPMSPIGYRKDGRPIFPIMGGAEGDPPATPPANTPPNPANPPADDEDKDDEEEEDDPDPSKGNYRIKKLSDEAAAHRVRAKAAEQALEAANLKLREYDDKDKSELEKAQRDAQEALERAVKAEEALTKQKLDNAFLESNTVKWKNAKTAMKLIDLSEVKINDDGEVDGMDKAIKALAKSDPYLLDGEAPGGGKPPSGGSGGKPPSGGGMATADAEALKKKYHINR